MKIFDTHAHYDDDAFNEDRDRLIHDMLNESIGSIVNVGASMKGCYDSVKLADKYDKIYAAIGIHPDDIVNLSEERMDWLRNEAINNPRVVAIGEIGLDYFYPDPPRDIQRLWFERQLKLAAEVEKPVIIHSRDACQDTLNILNIAGGCSNSGIIHCYSYSKESVRDYLKLGLYFGIGGVVTFKNAKKIVEALEDIPMNRIVLETDAPYLSPVPNRGKRNDSNNLMYVAETIAKIKRISTQEVIDVTYHNACSVFRL